MTDASETADRLPDGPALPTFDEMPLSGHVKETLAEMGYTHPTPVQHAIFDPAVRGVDLVVQARTGTGKTAAFGIPLVDQLVKRSVPAVQALVLAPTRELAVQVARELARLGARSEVKVVPIFGGAPMDYQVRAIRDGAHIVVGTPGRVLDHLRRGTLDPRSIRVFVLDEADEMLSMGFERELSAIIDSLPADRQTLLFSATIPPDIVRISRRRLRDPQFVSLSGDHIGALGVTHFVYFVREEKLDVLLRVLEVEDPPSAIIFCNTRDETERVAQALTRAGYDADWLNGELPQSEREKVMLRTREERIRFLVATDVAARGIDISHLTHVINFDFPDSPEGYVHRTGRTGRMDGLGTAISLVMPQDIGALYLLKLTHKIRPFERQIPTSGELKTRAEADIIQVLVDAFGSAIPHTDDLALARRLMTHDRCDAVLAGLLRNHLGERSSAQELASAARRARPPKSEAQSAPTAITAAASVSHPTMPKTESARRRRAREPESASTDARRRPADRSSRNREPTDPAVASRPQADRSSRNREPTDPAVASRPQRDATGTQHPVAQGRGPRRSSASSARTMRQGTTAFQSEEIDLPRYEVSPLPEELPMPAGAPDQSTTPAAQPATKAATGDPPGSVGAVGHAALANWSPPVEDNDDMPILGTSGTGEIGDVKSNTGAAITDTAEVFVNVGRRDGAHADDFWNLLRQHQEISADDVAEVRVRYRHSFVVVRREAVAAVLAALHGQKIGDKIAIAEPGKPKSAQPDKPAG